MLEYIYLIGLFFSTANRKIFYERYIYIYIYSNAKHFNKIRKANKKIYRDSYHYYLNGVYISDLIFTTKV